MKMRHRQTARQPRSPRPEIEEELNATTWRVLGWHSSARETREELSTRSHPSRTVLPTVPPSLANNRGARSANEPQQFASGDLSVRRRKHAPCFVYSGVCTRGVYVGFLDKENNQTEGEQSTCTRQACKTFYWLRRHDRNTSPCTGSQNATYVLLDKVLFLRR